MDISVIIVNFRSENFLLNCIRSLQQNLSKKNYEIIIVNNDSRPLVDTFKLDMPNLTIVNTLRNGGFSKACNIGAAMATGKILFFLNPDTELILSDFDMLFSSLGGEAVGIAAPTLTLPSGEIQPWSSGLTVTFWRTILNNIPWLRDECASGHSQTEFDWVSGAALAVTKKVFDILGGFDENFFMYFEDIDFCYRTKLAGYKILSVPEVSVLHIGGKSYNDISAQKADYYRSQDYYFQKHYGAITVFAIKFFRFLRHTSKIAKN